MRMNRKVALILLVVLLGVAFFIYRKWDGNRKQARRAHQVIHAEMGSIQTFISSTGEVLPKNRLQIKPPVNGRIEQILVKEGEMVKAGQIVAWMSSTDRAALLDAARGKGPEALAYWNDIYKPIALMSPIDGQVIVATMQPGQTVTIADAVVVLSDRLIFRAQVDETDIGKIMLGQDAVVTLDAYPDTRIKAQVDHVYYESTTSNNVTIYEVDLQAEALPAFCRSGMNVSVEFKAAGKENILTLPSEAIKKDKEGSYVLLKSRGKKDPERRPVVVGLTDDNKVEIVSGLSPKDPVLLSSNQFVLPKSTAGSNPFGPPRPPRGGRNH